MSYVMDNYTSLNLEYFRKIEFIQSTTKYMYLLDKTLYFSISGYIVKMRERNEQLSKQKCFHFYIAPRYHNSQMNFPWTDQKLLGYTYLHRCN